MQALRRRLIAACLLPLTPLVWATMLVIEHRAELVRDLQTLWRIARGDEE